MKIWNVVIDRKVFFVLLTIFVEITGFVGYCYINSDLNSSLSLNLVGKNCNQENLNDRLTCNDYIDKYSVSSLIGNGYLTKSIGLLSSDEVMLSGGTSSANYNYYLKTGSYYWTMSPRTFNSADVKLFAVGDDGSISGGTTSEVFGVRPVLSLRHEIVITGGDGSSNNPYIVDLPFTPSQLNERFADRISISYDESTLSADITVNTDGGWKYVMKPLSVTTGKRYRISFDYTITSDYRNYSIYSGIGLQVVDAPYSYFYTTGGDTGPLNNYQLVTKYMSTTAGTYSETLDFTAGIENYFVINCGMADDNQSINFKISNFYIREI